MSEKAKQARSFLDEPWTLATPPFPIADNLFYVGNKNVSCHLLLTTKGLILIDTAFPQTTYLLTESIRELGYVPADVRWILHTHGHLDHAGATRRLKQLSGSITAVGSADVETVETGSPLSCAEYLYGVDCFEPFEVDHPLQHGENLDFGDVVVACHHTPGHTPGTMSYTFPVRTEGRELIAGIFGGPGLWTLQNGHREEQGYSENRTDFAKSLHYLKNLRVDIWLGAHPGQNDTFLKRQKHGQGTHPNPFIDPDGWSSFLSTIEANFKAMMRKGG